MLCCRKFPDGGGGNRMPLLVKILSGVFCPDVSCLALCINGRALTPQMQKLAGQEGPRDQDAPPLGRWAPRHHLPHLTIPFLVAYL